MKVAVILATGRNVLAAAKNATNTRRMQLIATIDDPVVIQRILAHLGLPGARAGPPPPSAVSAARAEQRALPYVTR
jgi:hypothetical protein